MFQAASAHPAGPGERDADVFPLRERLRFRDRFGLALLELRARSPAFQELAKGPWALFIAIAVHWQGNAEAWPGQATLARFSGWSTRAVRDHASVLERCGFLRVRRERRANGSERIFYAPGLVTLAALGEFVERFPRDRAKLLGADVPPAAVVHPPAAVAATPPEGRSIEPRDQDPIKPSSCVTTEVGDKSSGRAEEQQLRITAKDEEVARQALAERMKRKHPTRPRPRWFDAGEVAVVARCVTGLEGDADAKIQAQRDAITGAFLVSKDRPPTVRFIWGKLEHFFEHVDRGRRRRLAEAYVVRERVPQALESMPPVRPRNGQTIHHRQMNADLERLFGPGWESHVRRR